jgi:8-oxo-dGTP pyrophosphatase MutT (NUDIX family)
MVAIWKKLSSVYVLENPWYKVRQDKVIRPDGKQGLYNVVECGQSVFIVPVTEDHKIILIKQFRYTTQRGGWELPAGSVDEGEDPLTAAKRELKEETGFVANDWQSLDATFDSMNGMCDAVAHVFIARNLKDSHVHEQTAEGITGMQSFSFQEIVTMIQDGRIVDGLSIASLMKFFISEKELEQQLTVN